ncbi:hypothetical protein M406DRAFT_107357 [Cryphonectria parasitica EP155]|uniref:Uncharacterized protein n=1 Tax=Cryphonectria parasitica (strain ATCC 38755 / EP155) TaxID=660469 RepID=A0A9P5CNS6_CRYP1|nr:uncharacterized protein M406DRAFT_107357 [Cryphonectria parasitica EP155]KAF3764240.1 hypothetical protein M406DRAFT_107357 [Cryphonectria parasitica EP155]
MPRQAARLVLGRSVKAKTIRQRPFSTTPRRSDDDAKNNSSSSSNSNARNQRSVAAASALGAMSNSRSGAPSSSSSSSSPSQQGSRKPIEIRRTMGMRPPTLSRPPGLGQGRNIIDLKSLPRRTDGAPRFVRPPPHLGSGSSGGDRPAPGSSGFVPRFAGRTGGGGGGGFQGAPRGNRFGPGARTGGSLGSFRPQRPGGGRFGGQQPRTGGGGARRGPPRRKRDDKKPREQDATEAGMEQMDEEVQKYVATLDAGGVERPYKPSTTLESLIGWGPAVATNTAIGQAEIAVRNMRIMGGGRGFQEAESTFELKDVNRWLSAGQPIFYSNMEQKKGVTMMLSPGKADKIVEKKHAAIIEKGKEKYGEDWAAFVKAYNKRGTADEIEKKSREQAERVLIKHVNDRNLVSTKNKTTREAIIKYAVKGDHPVIKQAEDTWGKLAMYAAHERSYRPVDAARLEAKVRTLVKA